MQRGFGWYLNFKATLGALPISPTLCAQPPLLVTTIPSSSCVQPKPVLHCSTLENAKKVGIFPAYGKTSGLKGSSPGSGLLSQIFLKVLKRQLEWVWVPFVQRGNKAHLLWLYITSRVLHPCERAPNLEMRKLTRRRNSSSI